MRRLLFQHFISRSDLQLNPNVLYVFGDNLMQEGYGGQAKEMRGEPNAVGIPTKVSPYIFMSDISYDANKAAMEAAAEPIFEHLQKGGIVVLPMAGLGTGRAELAQRAPKTAGFVEGLTARIVLAASLAPGYVTLSP